MISISVNKFRENLKRWVEDVVSDHAPLKVTRRGGEDFIVVSAEDWEREQETLYVLQNNNLIKQIVASNKTHKESKGYQPTEWELNEIIDI